MNVLPVITRELRPEARHPFTYWVRVFGAGAAFAAAAVFLTANGMNLREGGQLLLLMHGALHLVIWLLVPLLTADCLSRERREGTLGILFLTALTARDIVVAKSLTHGLRAVTVLLAVLPVVILPMLMGGVVWQQAAIAICLDITAVCLALAAGLIASSLCKSWIRSLVLAMSLAALLALGSFFAFAMALDLNPAKFGRGYIGGFNLASIFWNGFQPRAWDYLARIAGGTPIFVRVLPVAAGISLGAFATLGLAVLFAARMVARTWQDRPPHPLLVWLQARFCRPVMMHGLLERWMRQKLDRNPIGWLEHRTWSGRIVIWGWLAVMVSVYSYALSNTNFFIRSLHTMHLVMGWGLLLSMTFSAANSLRRERENGALELLLVSPLSEAQILFGRLRGLWGQFLPSVMIFLGGWTWLAVQLNKTSELSNVFLFAMSFLAMPVIGLYFSLLCKNFLTSLLWTIVSGLLVPQLLVWTSFTNIYQGTSWKAAELHASLTHPGLLQLGLALVLGLALHRRLVQRRFAMESN